MSRLLSRLVPLLLMPMMAQAAVDGPRAELCANSLVPLQTQSQYQYQYLGPNVEDFQRWQSGQGTAALIASLDRRHSRNLLFKYYFDHLKRLLAAGFVVQVLALAPNLPEIPGYLEAYYANAQIESDLTGSLAKADELARQRSQQQRAAVISERRRLEAEILRQGGAGDPTSVAALKGELQELCESYPWVVYVESP